MRCITYARVSTDAQERDGTSLDSQEEACAELATERGWTVVRRLRDAASGFYLDRDGIEELRGLLRRGEIDAVVAYAVDRLSRNQNHIGVLFDEIKDAGATLEFVTERFEDTAVGRFILAARAFIGEVEREKIAERTMRGKVERAKSGRLPQGTGAGIYGYTYDTESGTRSINEEQAPTVRRIFEEFAAGTSCNRLANDLNQDLVPAFKGGRWHALTVRRMLRNESYAGRTVYRRTRTEKVRDAAKGRWVRRTIERDSSEWIDVDGVTPAIVSRELFDRAQTRLSDPERRNRARPSRSYPLKGRLRCGICGSAMVGQSLQGGRYQYYRCRRSYSGPKDDRCASRYVPRRLLEGAVRDELMELLSDPDRVIAEACHLAERPEGDERRSALDSELNDVEARQRRLVRLFTAGDMPESLLTEESRELSERRSRLEAERARLPVSEKSSLDPIALSGRMPKILESIRSWIAEARDGDFDLLLRAVDVQISASREQVEIRGEIPMIEARPQSELVTIERTSA